MALNTVAGVFPDEQQAREVAEDLRKEGFGDDNIYIGNEETPHKGGFVAWIENLFGAGPEEHVQTYRSALENGQCVVAVNTDESHLNEAADIMERHCAIEVDEAAHFELPEDASGSHEVPVPRHRHVAHS